MCKKLSWGLILVFYLVEEVFSSGYFVYEFNKYIDVFVNCDYG